jgi:phosphohistidine phosphatase SixA
LRASQTYLVRHAKAEDRHSFKDGDDRARPLTRAGVRQAESLGELLGSCDPRPELLLSSPARRCLETLGPLATRLGIPVAVAEWLAEGAHAGEALRRLRRLGAPAAACTHGDLIWGVLEHLAREGVDLGERPAAAKGSVWVLGSSPRSARYLEPPASSAVCPGAAC